MSCISVKAKRVGGIKVSVGLVCDVGLGRFMRVTPEDVQWITIDTSVDYNIESNVLWNIQ